MAAEPFSISLLRHSEYIFSRPFIFSHFYIYLLFIYIASILRFDFS